VCAWALLSLSPPSFLSSFISCRRSGVFQEPDKGRDVGKRSAAVALCSSLRGRTKQKLFMHGAIITVLLVFFFSAVGEGKGKRQEDRALVLYLRRKKSSVDRTLLVQSVTSAIRGVT
jgi:hypothetical protein